MKYLILLISLISFHVMASITPLYIANAPTPKDKTFSCTNYTDNEFDPSNGEDGAFISDNPIQTSDIKILQTANGFEVTAKDIFKETRKLTNPNMAPLGSFAGDNESMLFKMEDDDGKPYFLWYLSPVDKNDTPKKPKALIDRVLTFATCTVE